MNNQHSDPKKDKAIPSNPLPKGRTEEDPDELVHEQHEDEPPENEEIDPDDQVHRQNTGENKDEDPDDLVHPKQEEDDE